MSILFQPRLNLLIFIITTTQDIETYFKIKACDHDSLPNNSFQLVPFAVTIAHSIQKSRRKESSLGMITRWALRSLLSTNRDVPHAPRVDDVTTPTLLPPLSISPVLSCCHWFLQRGMAIGYDGERVFFSLISALYYLYCRLECRSICLILRSVIRSTWKNVKVKVKVNAN